jgi:hypothetical protein
MQEIVEIDVDDWYTDDIAFAILYTPFLYGGYCNFIGVVSHG